VANWIVEGAMDSHLFDRFLDELLFHVRSDAATARRDVVILMDNATIHHHSRVYQTIKRYKANALYNAPYSPWLNPVELYFKELKR